MIGLNNTALTAPQRGIPVIHIRYGFSVVRSRCTLVSACNARDMSFTSRTSVKILKNMFFLCTTP